MGISVLDPLLVPFTTSLTSLVLSQVPISQIHALPSGLFFSLERLVLYIDEDDYQQNTWLLNGPVAAFESAPVLQRVATNKILAGSGAISFRLPWQQLTHFIEDDCDKNAHRFLIHILPQCVTLQWLGILLPEADLGQAFEELWDNQPVRIMPSLISLSLNLERDQYPNFFDNFKFPGLRALRLKGGYMDFDGEHANADSWDPDEVNRFFDKIANEFRLDYLSVCANLIYRSTLERLFRATPHVTVLDAHIWEKFENLFETLTISQSPSQCFLPRLETLVLELGSSVALEYNEGETIDPDAFALFLESRMRCAPEGRLRKIVLYGRYPDQVSDETPFVQVIQRYMPEGLLLEREVLTELRQDRVNVDWTERDPELQDWLEANAIIWCLPEHDLLIDILPSKAPVLLTHVCRRWREVAIEFVRLWASLKLPLREPETLEGSNLQTIAEVLKRCKKAPIRLQVAVARNCSVGVSILDPLLIPFTTSLTSLVLSRVPISQIHALPSGLFPSLERLVLYIDEDDYQQNTWLLNRPVAAFESAPVLQRVATNKILAGSGAISFRLPWQQLTHFIEDDCDENAHRFLIDILPQCVTLRWLGILLLEADLGQAFEELWDNQPVRIMPSLVSLSLDLERDQYPNFFDNFKFPGLRALRLKGGYMDFDGEHANADFWDPDEVNRFFNKIANEFRLDYLSVCANLIYRSTLERLFRATPHVTVLDAHIWEKFENLFETLTISQSPSQCFLPQLKTLVLELGSSAAVSYGETIDPDAFASFLESRMRCAPEDRLRKIVLYGRYPDQVSDETPFVQVIQRYLPEGLSLERRVVTELRYGKLNVDWTERDPELQDWLEANAINWQ
ncbi:hypothetical protein H1R20_g802, partial [Candolleomyces eurysporus]